MASRDSSLLKILQIGRETSLRGRGILIRDALKETGYSALRSSFEAPDLVPLLASSPELVQEWIAYSQDKRTDGGWYLLEEREIGQIGNESARERFDSIQEAVAQYVVRELDFWFAAVSKAEANTASVNAPGYGNRQFSRDVIERFPELRQDLGFDANLLHPQIGDLAAAVRQSVESGESDLPLRICSFLEEALSRPDAISEIENAVAISFVQPSELRRSVTGELVLRSMPDRVRRIILEQEARVGVW